MLCFDEKATTCFISKSSISHHNKLYDYENDNKYKQKPEKQ